jgi:hypothetical protein
VLYDTSNVALEDLVTSTTTTGLNGTRSNKTHELKTDRNHFWVLERKFQVE